MNKPDFKNDLMPLKDMLFRLAMRITLDRAEAEDVTEDTLIRVWNKRDEWSKIKSVEAYAMTICRNLALDRSQKREAMNVSLEEHDNEAPDNDDGPHEKMVRSERLRWVHKFFQELPEKQRTVMQLRDIEEKNIKETAEIIGISEQDVKVTLFRARQAIRNKLQKLENYGL